MKTLESLRNLSWTRNRSEGEGTGSANDSRSSSAQPSDGAGAVRASSAVPGRFLLSRCRLGIGGGRVPTDPCSEQAEPSGRLGLLDEHDDGSRSGDLGLAPVAAAVLVGLKGSTTIAALSGNGHHRRRVGPGPPSGRGMGTDPLAGGSWHPHLLAGPTYGEAFRSIRIGVGAPHRRSAERTAAGRRALRSGDPYPGAEPLGQKVLEGAQTHDPTVAGGAGQDARTGAVHRAQGLRTVRARVGHPSCIGAQEAGLEDSHRKAAGPAHLATRPRDRLGVGQLEVRIATHPFL